MYHKRNVHTWRKKGQQIKTFNRLVKLCGILILKLKTIYKWMFLILFSDIFKHEFLKNRTIFKQKTNFHQFSNMASSGLKKMLTLIIIKV